jgi:imidazolonepropionase
MFHGASHNAPQPGQPLRFVGDAGQFCMPVVDVPLSLEVSPAVVPSLALAPVVASLSLPPTVDVESPESSSTPDVEPSALEASPLEPSPTDVSAFDVSVPADCEAPLDSVAAADVDALFVPAPVPNGSGSGAWRLQAVAAAASVRDKPSKPRTARSCQLPRIRAKPPAGALSSTHVPTLFRDAASIVTLAGPAGPRRGTAMGELGSIERASLLVGDDGRIAWVGASQDLHDGARESAGEVVDCAGKTLVPALVDAHTHLVWAGDRKGELELRLGGADYEEIFRSGGGILSSVRETRAATEDELHEQSLARIGRMRRAGTTTFEIKSGYGLELEAERRQLRVARRLAREDGFRVRTTCLAAHAIPADLRGVPDGRAAFVARVCDEILPAVAAEGLADAADVFCDRGAFTVEEARTILARARALGLRLRVHANELGPTGGARLAAELGADSADHLLHIDDDDRARLRDAGTTAVLLPGTSLVLGKPFADGRALVDAGVPVAVATDCNPGSCAFENLALCLALACYGNRLSPAQALCAATHNAAASLGLDHEVGSLVPGRAADLLVLGTPDYRDLVYHAGSPLVEAVWQRGVSVA